MDLGNGENSGDDQGKKPQHRYSAHQTQILEAFFKDCPHPNKTQRLRLCGDLGLDLLQVKFWFQNKRTQTKVLADKTENTALRDENLRIILENKVLQDALNCVLCPECGGPPLGGEDRQQNLINLHQENAQLREQGEKIVSLFTQRIGRPITPADLVAPFPPSQGLGNQLSGLNLNPETSENPVLPNHISGLTESQKARMSEIAASAMEELTRLLRANEPLWVESPNDGRYFIHHGTYVKDFPNTTHSNIPTVRIESSKDSGLVAISATKLVDMFLGDKWADLFPTIITRAKTLQVLEAWMIENKDGALLLMYEQMHVLSPLVASRDFYFLRHCKAVEQGVWVVVDVSFNFFKEISNSYWKLPSGFMIEEMPNMCSKVTWVEHIEVDYKPRIHRLYKDLMCGNSPYGADCWLSKLQWMSERMFFSVGELSLSDFASGIILPAGKSGIMKLSERMMKRFCSILSMPDKMKFPKLAETNNSGVRFSVSMGTEPIEPSGMIVTAASSLWLPLPRERVFSFFLDIKMRNQWDVLSGGCAVSEIAHITTGTNPGNSVSLILPYVPSENFAILQETCIDSMASLLIYAPIDIAAMHAALGDEDTSDLEILPSGFIVSGDGHPDTGSSVASSSARSGGSLLTVVFQLLASSVSMELQPEKVAKVNGLVSSTVQRIKTALGC